MKEHEDKKPQKELRQPKELKEQVAKTAPRSVEVESQTDENAASIKEALQQEALRSSQKDKESRTCEEQEKPEELKETEERQEKPGKGKSERVATKSKVCRKDYTDREKELWMETVKAAKGSGKDKATATVLADEEVEARREDVPGSKSRDTAEQRENRAEAERIIAERCSNMKEIKPMLDKLMSTGPFDIDLMQRFAQYGSEVEKAEDEELDRQLASSSEDDQELETVQGANRGLLGRFTPWRK